MTDKIIIDTDPGVDDAFAILLALNSPELQVLGLTTVFGNVAVETSANNALILADFAQYDVPVFKGMAQPLKKELEGYPDFVHGKDGFGNINWPASESKLQDQNAVDWMAQTIKENPGEITLVPLGPLTNIGALIQQYPEVVGLVKKVVLMGGAVYFPGNISPVAEANIYNDPDAADAVFAANWPVYMVGLDVTSQVLLTKDRTGRIADANPGAGTLLHKSADFYIDFYRGAVQEEGCYMHDPLTVAYLINPDLVEFSRGSVRVLTEGYGLGQTTFAPEAREFAKAGWNDRPIQNVALNVNGNAALALLEARLSETPDISAYTFIK
jgi:inosine-uridine nucleoside N-ribohydrolase